MPKFLNVNIQLPYEYDTANVDSPKVAEAIARVFPHDPTLDAVRQAGGKVSVTLENQAQPAPTNPPATVPAPAPTVATPEAPKPEVAKVAEPTPASDAKPTAP